MKLKATNSADGGLTLNDFFALVDDEDFNRFTTSYTGISKDYYNAKVSDIMEIISSSPQINDSFSEESISSNRSINSFKELAKLLLMIIALWRKFEEIKNDVRFIRVNLNLSDDFGFNRLLSEIDSLKEMKVNEFLKYILKRHIIDQHDYRMYIMNDLRRCWFTKENERYIFQADESPIWRPAKFNIIQNFLIDMNLIEFKNELMILTPSGKKFYKFLRTEFYS